MNVSEFLSLKAEKHTPFGGNQFMSLEWSHPRGRGKPLAQTLAQTGFFSPWHCPASVAPGRAGFLYGTDYYSGVAPGRARPYARPPRLSARDGGQVGSALCRPHCVTPLLQYSNRGKAPKFNSYFR